MQAVQFDPSAKMISAEVHGVHGTMFISAWLKGQIEGVEYADAKINAQVTVDIEDTANHVKGRFKGSIMILDGLLYAKLDSMEGTFEDDVLLGTIRLATKKWINFPVDAATVADIQDAIRQSGDPSEADDRFTLARTPYQYGSSYTLTLKSDVDATIKNLEIKVDTDYKDVVQVSKLTFEGTAGDFAINGQAKAERMKTPLSFQAPVDAVSMDWLIQHLSSLNPETLFQGEDLDFDSDSSWNDFDAEDMHSIDETENVDIAPSSASTRRRIRPSTNAEPVDRVDSGISRPSRRSLKMGNTNRK